MTLSRFLSKPVALKFWIRTGTALVFFSVPETINASSLHRFLVIAETRLVERIILNTGILATATVGFALLAAATVGSGVLAGAIAVLRSPPDEAMFIGGVWTAEVGRSVGLVIAATGPAPAPIMAKIVPQLTIEANKQAAGVPTK